MQEQNKNIKRNNKISVEEYCDITDQMLPQNIATFVKTQVQLSRQLKKSRKYSNKFKKYCLNLYLNGIKTYNLLTQLFCLPSAKTIQRMIENLKIPSGLNNFIFEFLKTKINNSNSLDKYCILCMDKASLKPNLYYNISQDEVIGFEDLGEEKSELPACNVAVLMLQGMCNNWKLPLAYFFLNSTFSATKLKSIIIETIKKLQEIDYKVIALVTDMGENFMLTAKALGITEDTPFFIVNDQQIAYLIGPPHALKAIRNML